jgi:putative tryptophan/tyrosine transport system substrate-binding protein
MVHEASKPDCLPGNGAWPQGETTNPYTLATGLLMSLAADDPESSERVSAFAQGMQQLGWTVGGNVRIESRWTGGDADLTRRYAAEMIALAPDVILATGGSAVAALQRPSRTVPIVFVNVVDPVGGEPCSAGPQRHRLCSV